MVPQLGGVANHHRLANMSSQRIEGMIHVAQMNPPALENLHSQAMLGKIFYTLLCYLNNSFLRCQRLVVRSGGADQAGQGQGGLPAIEQEIWSEPRGLVLQRVECSDSSSDSSCPERGGLSS